MILVVLVESELRVCLLNPTVRFLRYGNSINNFFVIMKIEDSRCGLANALAVTRTLVLTWNTTRMSPGLRPVHLHVCLLAVKVLRVGSAPEA